MIEKLKRILNDNRWIYVFLLALPSLNESFPTSYDIYYLVKDVFSILVLLLLIGLLIIKKKKISLLSIVLITIEAWWFISTVLNYGPNDFEIYLKTLYDICRALSLAFIIEYFLDDPYSLISGLLLNCEVAIYSYFTSFLKGELEPEKITHPLLNTMILWIMCAVILAYLHIMINKRYIRGPIMIAVTLFITYQIWSATSVVALAGFYGVLILGFILLSLDKTKSIKIPSWFFVLIAVLANLFVLFVYVGKGQTFPVIDFFIEKVLGKSTTFTERDVIWNEAMRLIKEKPVIGHGFRPALFVTNSGGEQTFPHAHNQILQRLLATGVIGLIQFIIFHLVLIRKIDSGRNSYSRIVAIAAVFAVCITYITEAYKKFFVFYLVFFVAYHVEELIKNRKEKPSVFSLLNKLKQN